ncbi:MAG: arsenate reductase ArsC [Rhodobacterales bacterium]|nr:arsenate reductase ArsC [Rhodobacterales bacterium]
MNILVLCTGNSARSILLEAILNCLGKGRLKAYSAGSKPIGTVNTYTIELLKKKGITKKFRSKSWTTFSTNSEITMDIVITVCGNARDEECPYWPGNPLRAHWEVPDPASIKGSTSEREIAFSKVYNILEKRAKAFLDLKFENMKSDTLQKNIDNISRIV